MEPATSFLNENQQYNCLVCNSLIKFKIDEINSVKANVATCHNFCILSGRYLNFRWNCNNNYSDTITKQEFTNFPTPTTSENIDSSFNNKKLLCEKCLPLADEFCSITDQWNYVQMLYNWRLKTTLELIKARIAGHHNNSNDSKINENLNTNDIEIFREKFSTQVCNRVFKEWPRLKLERCKIITKNNPTETSAETVIENEFAEAQTEQSTDNHDIVEEANIDVVVDDVVVDFPINKEITHNPLTTSVEDTSVIESTTDLNQAKAIHQKSNKTEEFALSVNNTLKIEPVPVINLSDDDDNADGVNDDNKPDPSSVHGTKPPCKNNNSNTIRPHSESTSSKVFKNSSVCRNSTPKPYKCVVCKKRFRQIHNKDKHEKIAHSPEEIKTKSSKLYQRPKATAERESRELTKPQIDRYSTKPKMEGRKEENIVKSSSNSITSKKIKISPGNHVSVKSHTKPKKTQITEKQTDQKSVAKVDSARCHKCTRCGKGFLWLTNKKRHEVHCDNIRHKQMIRLTKTKAKLQRLEQKLDREAAKKMKINAEIKEKPFSCQFCGHRFTSDEERISHEGLHTWERPRNCEICGKRFLTNSKYRVHKKVAHGLPQTSKIIQNVTCIILDDETPTASSKDKETDDHNVITLSDTDDEDKGQTSNDGSNIQNAINAAVKTVYSNNTKIPTPKNVTNKSDTNLKAFNDAVKTVYSDKNEISNPKIVTKKSTENNYKSCNCIDCGKRFTTLSDLKSHERIRHGRGLLKMIDMISRKEKFHTKKKKIRQKEIESSEEEDDHDIYYDDEKEDGQFRCRFCGKTFMRLVNYRRHQNEAHKIDKSKILNEEKNDHPNPSIPIPVIVYEIPEEMGQSNVNFGEGNFLAENSQYVYEGVNETNNTQPLGPDNISIYNEFGNEVVAGPVFVAKCEKSKEIEDEVYDFLPDI